MFGWIARIYCLFAKKTNKKLIILNAGLHFGIGLGPAGMTSLKEMLRRLLNMKRRREKGGDWLAWWLRERWHHKEHAALGVRKGRRRHFWSGLIWARPGRLSSPWQAMLVRLHNKQCKVFLWKNSCFVNCQPMNWDCKSVSYADLTCSSSLRAYQLTHV